MDWKKISDNLEVIELIKEIEKLESKIRKLDDKALIRYQLEILSIESPKNAE